MANAVLADECADCIYSAKNLEFLSHFWENYAFLLCKGMIQLKIEAVCEAEDPIKNIKY